MEPKKIVYNIFESKINEYLKFDYKCEYVYYLYAKNHLCENAKGINLNKFNSKLEFKLQELERVTLNWFSLAEIEEKNFEENFTILFKGNIFLTIKEDGVFYFQKYDEIKDKFYNFLIIYQEHPAYMSFLAELKFMLNDCFELNEERQLQKILSLNKS